MTEAREHPLIAKAARDEAFDLALYVKLRDLETGEVRNTLSRLVNVERGHVTFWSDMAGLKDVSLNRVQRFKLAFFILLRRFFGVGMTFLILEAIEIYGIKKYWTLWDQYKDTPQGPRIKAILRDEFGHEDEIVADLTGRRLNAERVRDIFLGLNDGLVEVLGSVSGSTPRSEIPSTSWWPASPWPWPAPSPWRPGCWPRLDPSSRSSASRTPSATSSIPKQR